MEHYSGMDHDNTADWMQGTVNAKKTAKNVEISNKTWYFSLDDE